MHSRVIATFLLVLLIPTLGAAQGTPAAAECPGGPPGPGGFLLAKASATASLMAATQDQTTLGAQLTTIQNWNVGSDTAPACGSWHQRTLQDISVSYDGKRSAAGVLNITRNFSGLFQHMFFLASNASYAYVVGDLYHNNSLGLDLKQAYGAGVGYARNDYEVNIDVRFMHEQFLEVDDPARLLGIRLGGRYTVDLSRLVPDGTLSLGVNYVPVLNADDSWLADGAAHLVLPFNQGQWGFIVSLQDNYMRNAPPNFKRNYLKASAGLSYTRK